MKARTPAGVARPLFLVLLAAAVWIVPGDREAPAADGPEPGSPCTYLFDTGATAAEPLPAAAVAGKKGWKVLAEDDTTHKFIGDTVLLNDRLVLVLRGKAAGAELYAQGPSGPVRRAAVVPVGAGGGVGKMSAIRIRENNPGAVMVEAGFQSDKGVAKLTYRLTTGQTILELRPGEGVQRVRVDAPSRYVAVPDFFGDDMIFAAGQSAGPRLRLPTENFLLHFIDGGCLLMCVWPSSRQQAAAVIGGEGPQRVIQGSEIDCAAGKSLWIGVLEGPGIWHEQAVPAADAPREMVLDWKPPFPAKWRASSGRDVWALVRRGTSAARRRATSPPLPAAGGRPAAWSRACPLSRPARTSDHTPGRAALAGGLPDRPEPDHAADDVLPDRHPAGHAWASGRVSTSSRPRAWPPTPTPRPTT